VVSAYYVTMLASKHYFCRLDKTSSQTLTGKRSPVERCGSCGKPALQPSDSIESWSVGSCTFFAKLRVSSCGQCGLVAGLTEGRIQLGLLAAAEFVKAGDFRAPAMKHMRRVLGLTATSWGSLIGVSAETISRWETGQRPLPRLAALSLGSMVMDRLNGRDDTRRQLEALKRPRPLPRRVDFGAVASR